MEQVIDVASDLVQRCQQVLAKKGRLSTAIPGFEAREAQITLSLAIAKAINDQTLLVAEAGTGTGKTFAYLTPALLSGKKTLISTATKTLQDQLFEKDLPLLIKALGLSVRVQNLKGRANYICRYRTQLHVEEGRFNQVQCVSDIIKIQEKIPRLKTGDRTELPEIAEESPVWPYVTSTGDNCLGQECEFHKDCFLMKARKRAMEAEVVVINHHLFFADSRIKEEGFGELLPGAEIVVFDEAHQLAEIVAHFSGERLGTRQLREVMDDLLREWPVLDLANQPLKQMSLDLDKGIDQLLLSITHKEDRLALVQLNHNKAFFDAWEAIITWIAELLACINNSGQSDEAGVKRCVERLEAMQSIAKRLLVKDSKQIRWIERFKHSLVYQETPFDVAESFSQLMEKATRATIFTSATLTMADSFACFINPLGLTQVETLLLPSPFDYQQQALLYLPRGMPDPKSQHYYETLLERAVPVINAFGGRCFFLFTSHRALRLVADRLHNTLKYPLLVQGDEAKPILLARFRSLGNAVLLGTATFWEGVDVKGEALSCVIIDKLPFASPTDPVIQGKMAYYKSKGLSGFDELSLPNAVLALKQGVGRLIRDVSDRGVLMIADPRLTSRAYAQQIFASLPSLRKTRNEQVVLDFIQQLALTETS